MQKNNALKVFIKYTSFSMLSMIGMSCYVLADTLFIANGVGLKGLTALNLVLPIYNIIFGIGILVGFGGATRFSIIKSQGKDDIANAYYSHSLYLGLLFSIPIFIIGLLFSKDIATLLGANHEVKELASIYLRTFILFTPFFIFSQIIVTFVRNDHNPRLASLAMLSGTIFNIIFDYILVFPCHLGMFGAALATGFSPVVALLICSLHFIKKENQFHFTKPAISFPYIKNIISIGTPSFITELSSGIITFAFNMVILNIGGNIAVASYGIICNLAIVVTSLYTGLSQGIQPLISQSYGQKQIHLVNKYLKYAVILALVISTLVYAIMLCFPETIISFFNSDHNEAIIDIAKVGFIIYFSGFFFVGINMIYISYFASTEQVKPSFLISTLRSGVIIVPLVLLLSHFFSLTGVWLSFPLTEFIVCLIVIIYNIHLKRKNTFLV